MSGIAMAAIASAKTPDVGAMTAGTNGTQTGFIDAAYAAFASFTACGSTTGATTSFGIVSAMYSQGAARVLEILAPTGTPTGIAIGGALYALSFGGSSGGFDGYTIIGAPAFVSTTVYDWVLY